MPYRPLWKSLVSEARGGKGLILAIDAALKAIWDYIGSLTLLIRHIDTTGQTPDDHHNELHSIVSHSDTTATGIELDNLTNGSNADLLHVHAIVDIVTLGATTLSTITGRVNGLHIIIAASNSSVVDETGNIILSGAASFNMQTGDTITLAYDGSNWRETGRSFAS